MFPVSIKGVVFIGEKVVLLKNERDEWELPGGRIESGESPELCVCREIQEELNLDVSVSRILDSWVYLVAGKEVMIITYHCITNGETNLQISHEHKELGLFTLEEVANLNMPQGYKNSIASVC